MKNRKLSISVINTESKVSLLATGILLAPFFVFATIAVIASYKQDRDLSMVGDFIWIVIFLIFGFRMVIAQKEYLLLYRKKVNPPFPLTLNESLDMEGLSGNWFALIHHTWEIQFKPQSDPELEQSRKRVINRIIASIIVMFGGLVLPFFFSLIK